MESYKYLIIGGGIAADAAVQGIRENDKEGTIGLICGESYPPYNRPPLSKALWKNEPEEILWRNTAKQEAKIQLSSTAVSIDLKKKTVTDNRGLQYSYEKLLLATGGKVSRLPFDITGIIYYRNYNDYIALRQLADKGNNFLVIGGGFIGSEIAAALAMNNKHVTMIFPENGIGAGIFPKALSGFLNDYYKEKKVRVISGDRVENITKNGDTYTADTKNGKSISVDGIIAGLGIKPETSLAESAGLLTDNGIVVNELLQTSDPDVYAAGDAANFFSKALDKRLRFEHEDNANSMGNRAGKNMVGGSFPYDYLPFFYSDLFDIGYEAVGDLSSGYQTVEQWKEKFREGIIYYLHHDRVKGVLLWNTWNQVDHARKLISDESVFNKKNVLNRLPG